MARRLALRYSDAASRDIEECARYMAKESPERARRWLAALDAALRRLEGFPESGVRPRDDGLSRRGFRMVVIGEILVFYLVRAKVVDVRRVVHGKRNYEFLL